MQLFAKCFCAISLLFAGAQGLSAQRQVQPEPLTAENVTAWLDGYLPYALKTADVAGAVVTVVKDGEVLVGKGYGYSDIENRTPVDPNATLFRPASISKLFLWTAIMQLVEQDKIDLDTNVQNYIDYQIDAPRGRITVRHLMTHTAGFEEALKDIFVENRTFEEGDLREYLVTHVPGQMFEPGTMPGYTNYASALAGYIVERVSGKRFETYIEDHIFTPLNMTRSSFHQPLPETLAAGLSEGYRTASDGKAQTFEIVMPMPAGALSATGADIAKFMISYLNGGAGLLRPETTREMLQSIDNQFPPINGFALGFYRSDQNGQRIVSHGGDTIWFHSDLNLFIDQNVGIFISMNSAGGPKVGPVRQNLLAGFTDRYFPERKRAPRVRSTAEEHGRAMVGVYETTRAASSSAFAIARFGSQFEVSMNDKNELLMPLAMDFAGNMEPLREIEPWVWQSASGRRVAARVENGAVAAIATEPAVFAFTPVPWHRSSTWLKPALGAAGVVLVFTFFAWPVRAYARRRFEIGFPYEGKDELAYRAAPIASLLVLLYSGAWAWFISWIAGNFYNFEGARNETWLLLLYVAAVLPLLATVLAGWSAYVKLTRWHGWFTKLCAILLVLACLCFGWFAAVVGLFSFNLNF